MGDETILWYVKNENTFNLDAIRIPEISWEKILQGTKKGKISSNPLGKNPEDDDIPNVKGNHIEKTPSMPISCWLN